VSAPLRGRWWIAGLYPLALLIVAVPVLRTLEAHWPVQFHFANWRFETFRHFFQLVAAPMLALLVAMVASHLLGHRLTLRLLSVFGWVLAFALVVALGDGGLTFFQQRGTVDATARAQFDWAGGGALALGVVAVYAAAKMARAAWRLSGRRALDRRGAPREVGLVVGEPLRRS
jgi:hypothetical protein